METATADLQVKVDWRMQLELAQRSHVASVVYIIVGMFIAWDRFGVAEFKELISGAGIVVTISNFCRLLLARKMTSDPERWLKKLRRYLAGMIAINSIALGLIFSAALYQPPAALAHTILTYFTLAGLSMAALTSISSIGWLFLFFQGSILVMPATILIVSLLRGTAYPEADDLVVIIAIALVYLISQRKVLAENLTKRFEFEILLVQEKSTLEQTVESLRQTRRDLDEQRAKSQNSAKLAALGEMAGGLAHEINNPLAIIQGHMQHIQQRTQDASDEHLKSVYEKSLKVVKAADRITAIIRGLRTFSRQADQDPFVTASVKNIVEDTLSFCREKMRYAGVELIVDIKTDIEVECRSVQISQVVLNLLNNASDAVRSLPSRQVHISAFEKDRYAFIVIEDSGAGVPQKITGRIFEPFFTTKEVGQGTGLGLSIAKGIIDDHHGEISVDREHRSRFTVRLPKVQALTELR